jgi:hypothetical protein
MYVETIDGALLHAIDHLAFAKHMPIMLSEHRASPLERILFILFQLAFRKEALLRAHTSPSSTRLESCLSWELVLIPPRL